MTAATSTQKNKTGKPGSFMRRRFFNGISENRRMLIVNIVLEIIGLPLIVLVSIIEEYRNEQNIHYYNNLEIYIVIGFIALAISILMGMIVAMHHFRYLYTKSIVDMNYSLPLNTRERFTADYLSGLFVYLVPAIGAVILSSIIFAIGSPFLTQADEVWTAMPIMLCIVSVVILGMILYYTLSVLSLTFCGSVFESAFCIIAVNVMIPAVIACLWFAIVSASGFGLDEASIMYSPVFNSTSPFGAAMFCGIYADDLFDDEAVALTYIRWVITTLIVTAIYLFTAYFLYKKRKAEDVSKLYVYKAYFYFIMTSAVFCILSLFIMYDSSDLFGGVFICAIGWFIMEVVTRRGFRRFWTAAIGFCAAVGTVLGICGICKETDGFGASRHVPSPLNISSVELSSYDLHIPDSSTIYRDRDVIKAAVELNKEIVDRHYNPKDYQYRVANNIDTAFPNVYDCQRIQITYRTRTGSTKVREYSFASGIAGDLVQAVLLSDEYAEDVTESIVLMSLSNAGHPYYDYETFIKDSNNYGGNVSYSLAGGIERSQKNLSHEKLIALVEAYKKDLNELTAEDLQNSHEVAEIFGYWVLDCFNDTLALMDKYGMKASEINSEDNHYDLDDIAVIANPVFYSAEVDIYNSDRIYYIHRPANDESYTLPDRITSSEWEGYYGAVEDYAATHRIKSYDAAADIMNMITPVVTGEYPLAVVVTKDNGCYYILDHGNNKEILEKAMSELYR